MFLKKFKGAYNDYSMDESAMHCYFEAHVLL